MTHAQNSDGEIVGAGSGSAHQPGSRLDGSPPAGSLR